MKTIKRFLKLFKRKKIKTKRPVVSSEDFTNQIKRNLEITQKLPIGFLDRNYEESKRECVIDKIMGDISKPIIICPNCVCVNDSINSKCHCCGESLINLEDREVLF